jgi:site-specific DNA-methyltransferase (adenine-specific)
LILWRGDCLRLLPRVPEKSIQLVLCDLPYGVTDCPWDKRIDGEALWAQYARVLKPGGAVVLFAMMRFAVELVNAAPRGWFRYELVWDKRSVSGWLNAGRRPMVAHESLLVFGPSLPEYFPQGLRPCGRVYKRGGVSEVYRGRRTAAPQRWTGYAASVLRFPRERGAKPAEKPVALLDWAIRSYTREGDTVLDNAMGLGSTGVAAAKSSREFIGMELDGARFREAAARIGRRRKVPCG